MTYQETLQYLFNQLPMYQRKGKAAYKADLENTLKLDEYFKHPHKNFRTIHVAGTNGKGSVSHMLASILQSAGYRTGLYTSPHLLDFRERIRIDGQMISERDVVDFVADNQGVMESVAPSFFEMTVAMAFDCFSREGVEVAVIEVGLGGRLDSTNIISPDLSVITNIGLDHTMFLGDDLHSIAKEKAGIIKSETPVVVGRYQSETADVFREKAQSVNAPVFFSEDLVQVKNVQSVSGFQVIDLSTQSEDVSVKLPLLGEYQQENLLTVVSAYNQLKKIGYNLNKNVLKEGIYGVVKQTGFLGRWQILSENPLVICDTGHNADGVAKVVAQLKRGKNQKIHIVWGMVNDKDASGILKMLPEDADYYFTRASIPRALDEKKLLDQALKVGLSGESYPNVQLAVKAAKKNASDNDLIFIGGSTFVVAEALEK
ncbi:bifunctional folylpolyglutamate synthase/dihydrofolate synthase [Marinilabilia rubra]|uniref:Dihydrofolate synthase/folylpolyglutamate synthase n=1 Tax=Marinilabilia rubra TaxID=2162893 RepID=A0A2U2BA00_9BACT|nr:folylpolyglutamate synthase/dihydrofolate synthase family protein [Marinilabilia rubra]PWD99874.1 dihydrofolate synthase [Marinilabilia rubra]